MATAAPSTCSPRLQKFPGVRPDPEAFIESLDPLQPRVYSISSSLKANPGRVSLTVDAVRYEVAGRARLGVCSTFLADRVAPGDRLRVYVQKARISRCPRIPKPVIMIGPGTGVAPFRAFLQERRRRRRPARTGCSSAISAATSIFSMRTNSPRCVPPGC